MRKDLLIIFILFLFVLPGFIFAQYIDDFKDEDLYNIGGLHGQSGWSSDGGHEFQVQSFSGIPHLGFGNEHGYYQARKQYFDNSLLGEIKLWMYFDFESDYFYNNPSQINLYDSDGRTCAEINFTKTTSSPFKAMLARAKYTVGGETVSELAVNSTNWDQHIYQRFAIEWSDQIGGGLKFRYSGFGTSAYTDWYTPATSTCSFNSDGIKDFEIIWRFEVEHYKVYVPNIQWSGENLIAPDGSSTSLKTRVKSLDGWTCQYSTSTEKWTIRALSRIIHEYQYDPQTDAIMELYDSSSNKLDQKSYSIRRDSGSGFFTQVFIENSFMREEFVRDYWFHSASSSGATSTTYVLKATFENQDLSSSSTVEQYFTINCDIDKYDRGGYLTIEELTDYYSSQTFTTEEFYDKWGFQAQLQKTYDRIKSIFPFSWVIAVQEIWTDVEESSYSSGSAFTLSFNMGTTSAAGFLQNKELKVVDFHEANEQYGSYITNFRLIFNYIIWISVVFIILRKIKGFFLSLNPSSTNT